MMVVEGAFYPRYILCNGLAGDSMGGDARLNLLLTHEAQRPSCPQPWYQTLSHLLAPLGVRTFEATSGQQAVELIEKLPIHLAVVDTRLPAISGMNVLRLIQQLRHQPPPLPPGSPPAAQPAPQAGFQFRMQVQERRDGDQRRIEVRFDASPVPPKPAGPAVILITPPQQDQQLLQEALKFNAFSVLSEPVDVNLLLETMARALRRFHQNQWPA
jgi:CheY-like chemotaxis protein